MLGLFLKISRWVRLRALNAAFDLVVTYILGSLSDDDDDGSENGKKYNRFILAKQQLCKCITLIYTSVCRHMLHDYDVKMPNFTLCGERELRATTSFLFFRTLRQSFRI